MAFSFGTVASAGLERRNGLIKNNVIWDHLPFFQLNQVECLVKSNITFVFSGFDHQCLIQGYRRRWKHDYSLAATVALCHG